MPSDAATLADTYFEAWQEADVDKLRAVLADDVSFRGPLAEVRGADEYAESIRGLFQGTDQLVRHRVWVDGDDALTWFDLHMPGVPATPVAQWIQARDGKIARVQVTFDPRAILAAAPG